MKNISIERDNNFTAVSIGDNLELFFSYKTVIAFRLCGKLTITENVWSNTTGYHLNYIDPDKTIRIPYDEFTSKLDKIISIMDLYIHAVFIETKFTT